MTRPTTNKAKARPQRAAARGSGTRAAAAASSSRPRATRSPKSKKSGQRSWFSPPIFTLWVVALIILACLLIWAYPGKHPLNRTAAEAPSTAKQGNVPPKAPVTAPKTGTHIATKESPGKSPDQDTRPANTAPPHRESPHPESQPKSAPAPAQTSAPPPAQAPVQTPVQAALRPAPAESPALSDEYQHIHREVLRDNVELLLREFFKSQGIAEEQVRSRQVKRTFPDGGAGYVLETEVQCGADRDIPALQAQLTHKLAGLGHDVESKVETPASQRSSLSINVNHRPSFLVTFAAIPAPPQPQEGTPGATAALASNKVTTGKAPTPPSAGLPPLGKAAIVIDDLGLDLKAARELLSIPLALTLSVMPQQAHTREISKLAHERGHEVLVHMPMEPHGYPEINPGPGALLVSMGGDRLRQELRSALASVPYASGVNNHMGSTFTERAEPMRTILAELSKQGLYFLDSYTTPESVACGVAEQLRVPCGRRDIFLDHEIKEDFVRSQIQRLIRQAKIQGASVAIGHPHPVTIKVLQQESALFAQERVAVVPLREVLRHTNPLRHDARH